MPNLKRKLMTNKTGEGAGSAAEPRIYQDLLNASPIWHEDIAQQIYEISYIDGGFLRVLASGRWSCQLDTSAHRL